MTRSLSDIRSGRADVHAASDPAALREAVIETLGVHFAQGDLELEELESRLAVAVRSTDAAALRDLVADLPAIAGAPAPVGRQDTGLAERARVPERGVLAAFMGGTVRKGSWALPRHLKIFATMGAVEVDLRQAVIAPGVTQIEVFAIMGGVEIIVPPGVRVETMGVAVMGGFESSAGDEAAGDAPVIRLSGLAVMAGVEAARRRPSARELRKFEKALAKARKTAR